MCDEQVERPRVNYKGDTAKILPTLALSLLLMLAGCAGPQLQVPRASPASVEVERQRQLELLHNQLDVAFRNRMEQGRRVFRVYSRLRTSGADLCGNHVAPFWGLWLADISTFPPEEQNRAKRILDLNDQLLILETAGSAAEVGLRAGDIVTKIDGADLRARQSKLQATRRLLEKAGMRRLDIEIMRGGQLFSATLNPQLGCGYSVTILTDPRPIAGTDGSLIAISTAMLDFTQDDDKLAHILSHEIAHNILDHPGRTRTNIVIGAILGGMIDLGSQWRSGVKTQWDFTRAGAKAGKLAYSQDFEREADYVSVYFMTRAGFDPNKAQDFWRDMAAINPLAVWDQYLGTHPSHPERAANIKVAIHEANSKLAHNEPLVPRRLGDGPAPVAVAEVDAPTTPPRVAVKPEAPPSETIKALKPIVPEAPPPPTRRVALLKHVKGRMLSSPPMVLQAEYLETEEGRGTSRLIYPGNYILEGEYRAIPWNKRFTGIVQASLMDPDRIRSSTDSGLKGFAVYSGPDGHLMECSFPLWDSWRIEAGRCLDNRGNEYRMTN